MVKARHETMLSLKSEARLEYWKPSPHSYKPNSDSRSHLCKFL